MENLDLVVIGAGPAGISAAVEAHRGGLERILVLEKGPSHSQMIRTFYKEGKRVDARYAGQEAICFGLLCLKDGNRESYLGLMDHVIESHQLRIEYGTEVWSIKRREDGRLEVHASNDRAYLAKAVVVAIGKMGRPKQPDYYAQIPGPLKTQKKILFDITSRPLEGLKILVVGGGDSAAEYCDILSQANEVTLSYRRAEFSKMNPINEAIAKRLVAEGRIRACMPSNIAAIEADGDRPRVRYAEAELAPETFDAVVYALGGMNPTEFLRGAGVRTNERGEAEVDEHHESAVRGLYVVGDLLGKGKGGGSIIAGFNSAAESVRHLLLERFGKKLEAEVVTLDHLRF